MSLRPLVTLFDGSPELLSPQGVPLAPDKLSRLRSVDRFAHSPALGKGMAVALRLVQEQDASLKTRMLICAEVLVGDNDWEPLCVCTEDALGTSYP